MTFFSCAGTRSTLLEMAVADADDSAVLNASRDSESKTDDERLERRMRRAVLDPAYLDGNFSDDESRRVLRSRTRNEEADKELAAMETEAVHTGDGQRQRRGGTHSANIGEYFGEEHR